MVSKSTTISRRTVLGAALATAVLPSLARGQQGNDPASQKPTNVKIGMTFNGQTMTATLYDNASARDLVSMLPLDLKIDNYSNNEKIAYLPRKLTEGGKRPVRQRAPGRPLLFRPMGQSGALLQQLSLFLRPDPSWPLRRWFRTSSRTRRIPAAHRPDLRRPPG